MSALLYSLVHSSTTPLLTVFLLGLLVAIDPCTLATAITAIGFIARDMENRRAVFLNGILYALGRTITYFALALPLVPIIRRGNTLSLVEQLFGSYVGLAIGVLFIVIGILMLLGRWIRIPGFSITSHGQGLDRHKWWGALLLGMLFALAICPAVGIILFGMVLPLTASSNWGMWLPLIFSLASALPVIVAAWILAFSMGRLGAFYNRMKAVQKWFNLAMAVLFIVAGVQMVFESQEDERQEYTSHSGDIAYQQTVILTQNPGSGAAEFCQLSNSL